MPNTVWEYWVGFSARLLRSLVQADARAGGLRVIADMMFESLTQRHPSGGFLRGFKGVRTRKGIRGYLVNIRPPKWRKTIWLGTYKTAEEAACAYDAGVFYTRRKKTEYNFPELVVTFPPLPSHLRFDCAVHHKEIKVFVQKQGRQAALFAKNRQLSAMEIQEEFAATGECAPPDLAPDARLEEEQAHVEADNLSGGVSMMDQSSDSAATESQLPLHRLDWEHYSESDVDATTLASQESQAEVTADSPCGGKSTEVEEADDLISRLAPSIRKHVEEALNSTLLPLVCALRSREEDEQKHREKLLALEEAKLALKRQKLQIKQRRSIIACRRSQHCSSSARSGSDRYELREKNPNSFMLS